VLVTGGLGGVEVAAAVVEAVEAGRREGVALVAAGPVQGVVGGALVPGGEDQHVGAADFLVLAEPEEVDALPHRAGPVELAPVLCSVTRQQGADVAPAAQVVRLIQDRKSTRLNSSHVKI